MQNFNAISLLWPLEHLFIIYGLLLLNNEFNIVRIHIAFLWVLSTAYQSPWGITLSLTNWKILNTII